MKVNKAVLSYFIFWTGYFLLFWSRSIFRDPAGNLIVSHVNLWGDWAIHFTMGSAMAYRELFPLESPLLMGAPFRYPFVANWISALLIRVGLPFYTSFTIPSFIYCVFSIAALYLFFKTLLKSKNMAVVASCLFLFNGGLGFVEFIKDPSWIPSQRYTRIDELFIHWMSVIDSMLIPQRAFQLGFPIGLIVLKRLLDRNEPRGGIWLTGILFGFLPIIHTHTFLAVGIIVGFWCFWEVAFEISNLHDPILRKWLRFWIPAGLLAVPLCLFFVLPGTLANTIKWYPGWYAHDGQISWLKFWWRNWGITPLAAAGGIFVLLKRQATREDQLSVLKLWTPFFLLFVLMNLFLFQAWIWDNTKLLVWASLGFVALAVLFLDRLTKGLAGLLIFLMAFSGVLDAYRLQIPKVNRNQMYSRESLELTDWTRKNTMKDSVWLTGPYHNNWLFNLTGRRALITYEGWLWTHGYNYDEILADVRQMYADPGRSDLFKKYKIDYAVIGPVERQLWSPNIAVFDQIFKPVVTGAETSVYATGLGGHSSFNQVSLPAPNEPLKPARTVGTDLKPGVNRREFQGSLFLGEGKNEVRETVDNFRWDDKKP